MWACLLQFVMFTTVFWEAGKQGIKCQQRIFKKMVGEPEKERMFSVNSLLEKN